MGEQIILAFEVVVDQGLGNTCLPGDLEGGGPVKSLAGKQFRGGIYDILFFFIPGSVDREFNRA